MKRQTSVPGTMRFRVAAVAVVALLGATGAAVGISNQSPNGPVAIVAEFDDASPLLVGNDVKVHGVKVGEVADMQVIKDNKGHRANVVLALEPAAMPLHRDATATVRPVSLLGERFIDLDRGSAKAPLLKPGGKLGIKQTSQATDLDQVLNTIDDPTGESLSALVTMLGQGMDGNGKNVDATIKALKSSMNNTDELVRILSDQNDLLTGMVDNFEPVAKALAADDGATLDRLVGTANVLLGSTAANKKALDQTLKQLPDTLDAARSTLGELAGAANATTPNLRAIRPTTDNLAEISQELQRFADAADPALASAKPVLQRAQNLLDQARPVVEQARAAGPDLRSVAADTRPLVRDLTKNLGNVLNFVRYWALTTNGYDGLSHYFRAMLVIDPDILTGMLPGGSPDDSKPKKPATDKPAEKLPGGLELPGAGGLLAPDSKSDGGVTGLNRQQEDGIMRLLIGGGS